MRLCWLLLGVALVAAGELPIALITSSSTSPEVLDRLAKNVYGVQRHIEASLELPQPIHLYWEFVNLTNSAMDFYFPQVILDKGITVFLDATNSPTYSQYLAYEAYVMDLLQVIMDRPIDELNGEIPSPNTVFMENSYGTEGLAFAELVRHYGWVNLGLMYNQNSKNIDMAAKFKKSLGSTVNILDEVIVDASDKFADTRIQQRLASTTKDSGARIILIFAEAVTASQFMNAGDQSVMGGSGYAWLLSSDAMLNIGKISKLSNADEDSATYGVVRTGALGFLQEDQSYASQEPMYLYTCALTLISQAYKSLNGFTGQSISGIAIKQYFLSSPSTPSLPYKLTFSTEGIRAPKYLMYNVIDFGLYEIGYWDSLTNQLVSNGRQILWPGSETVIPNDKVPVIKVALLYPKTDSNGNKYHHGQAILNGFNMALREINSNPIVLSKYQLSAVALNTALSTALAAINVKSLSNVNILGFAGPLTSTEGMAYIDVVMQMNDPKPVVSYGATATNLTSTDKFPRFMRIVQPDGLQAVAVAMFLQQYGWKKVGVVYTDDDYGKGIYNSFLTNVQTLDINIANTELLRIVTPANEFDELTPQCLASIKATLEDLVHQQVRIIIYLGSWRAGIEMLRQAVDKEIVGTKYAWIGAMWVSQEILDNLPKLYPDDYEVILDALDGTISLTDLGVQGDPGAVFEKKYLEQYKEPYTVYSMLAYDCAYLYAITINSMVERGEDFNNGKDLTDALRAADFTGASGKVKFSEGTNDRSAYGYLIMNYQKDRLVQITQYDPLNPNMFSNGTAANAVKWYDDTSPPGDSFSPYDCPFSLHMVSISVNGVLIVIAIGVSLFLVTLGLSIFSYRKWRQVDIQPITEAVVRSWKDTMVQVTIAIEFFQLVAIAPTFRSLQIVIESASNVFMIDAVRIAQQNKQGYWSELASICALCYLWFVLVILIMLNAETWMKRAPFCQRLLALFNSLYLPFIGNTMFLPFTALLVDAFICDHTAQKHAFVWRDCYMNCWGDEHYPYLAMSALAIVCFEPIAVFSRPLWQQAKTGLNIMSKPFFLLFKTCIQVVLIAVGKSLQGTSPIAHGVVFSILMLLFTVVTYRMRPFNYNRCNLWEVTSLLGVFYMSFLSTISQAGDSAHVAWFICLIIGWGAMGGVTFLIQRKFMPNMLVPPGGIKNKRKVYDALAIGRHLRDASSLDNSQAELKVGPAAPDVSLADKSAGEGAEHRGGEEKGSEGKERVDADYSEPPQ